MRIKLILLLILILFINIIFAHILSTFICKNITESGVEIKRKILSIIVCCTYLCLIISCIYIFLQI